MNRHLPEWHLRPDGRGDGEWLRAITGLRVAPAAVSSAPAVAALTVLAVVEFPTPVPTLAVTRRTRPLVGGLDELLGTQVGLILSSGRLTSTQVDAVFDHENLMPAADLMLHTYLTTPSFRASRLRKARANAEDGARGGDGVATLNAGVGPGRALRARIELAIARAGMEATFRGGAGSVTSMTTPVEALTRPPTLTALVRHVIVQRAHDGRVDGASIHAGIRRLLGANAPDPRRVTQAVARLCQRGELRTVAYAVYELTPAFDRAPLPTDPTRKGGKPRFAKE